jgi:hypothetical protein
LPNVVLALRTKIFTRINGPEGLAIPGEVVDVSEFKRVYAHPAASGRSMGAALSDLFWYWLAPGPEMHQEHLEAGEAYDEIAQTTRRMLAVPKKAAQELATECAARAAERLDTRRIHFVRLRDLTMPIWAEFYYQIVFGERCPIQARELIVGNANDVVTALKCCGLRHMKRRHRLTGFLIEKLSMGRIPHVLPSRLSLEQKAFYLQGTYFNTAVVQMSEAMVHLLMAIAQHPGVQQRLVREPPDETYLDRVIDESLRLNPLFGISHRISSADIILDNKRTIPKGTVLCFKHPEFQRAGFREPERFDPERWLAISREEANYIPFGVAANRPCPAGGIAIVTMRAVTREMLRRFAFYSSASHTRSIPNRGPVIAVPRGLALRQWEKAIALAFMHVRDQWEDVGRSLLQLVLGTYMIWDARRLRLCETYFNSNMDRNLGKSPAGPYAAGNVPEAASSPP